VYEGINASALEDIGERRLDLTGFVAREDSGLRQRSRPRGATRHIVFEESSIESKRGAKLEGRFVRRRVESAGPQGSHRSSVDNVVVSRRGLSVISRVVS
jgi:hypothetical protein